MGGRPAREGGGAAAAWLVLTALTTIPYLAAAWRPPPGRVFSGTFFYPDDFYQYLSFVEQATRGAFLFRNKFDLHLHPPVLVNLEWWAAGVLGRLAGGPVVGFHLLRLIALAGLVAAAARILVRAGLERGRLGWALVVVLGGGGLGWLRLWQGRPGAQIPDLLMGLYPWHESLSNPHFVAGTALVLWALSLHLDWRAGIGGRWPWLVTASALGLTRPFDLVIFILVALGLAAWDLRSPVLRSPGGRGMLELAWLLPVLLYDGLVLGLHPAFRVWSGPENLVPAPPAAEFGWALGLPALLAVFRSRGSKSRARSLSRGESPVPPDPPVARDGESRETRRALATWCAAVAALLAAGAPFALQFTPGLGGALLLLAALAIPARWLPAAALALCPTSLFLLWSVLHPWPGAFAPGDEMAAVAVLKTSCRPLDLAYAPLDPSLRIAGLTPCRVAVGHRVLTPDFAARAAETAVFYDPDTSAAWRRAYLDVVGARFLLLPAGRGDWLGANPPFVRRLSAPLLEVWQRVDSPLSTP